MFWWATPVHWMDLGKLRVLEDGAQCTATDSPAVDSKYKGKKAGDSAPFSITEGPWKTILGWTLVCWRLLIMLTERVVGGACRKLSDMEPALECFSDVTLHCFTWCELYLHTTRRRLWCIPVTAAALSWRFSCRFSCCHTSTDVCIDPVLHWWRSQAFFPPWVPSSAPPSQPPHLPVRGASHLYWQNQQQGLSGELISVSCKVVAARQSTISDDATAVKKVSS